MLQDLSYLAQMTDDLSYLKSQDEVNLNLYILISVWSLEREAVCSIMFLLFFQHVQWILPDIPALPVCYGMQILISYFFSIGVQSHCLLHTSVCPSAVCRLICCTLGKFPECPPGPCHSGDPPTFSQLDSSGIHLWNQTDQHIGV